MRDCCGAAPRRDPRTPAAGAPGRSVGRTASAGGLLLALAGAVPAAGGGVVVGGRRSRRRSRGRYIAECIGGAGRGKKSGGDDLAGTIGNPDLLLVEKGAGLKKPHAGRLDHWRAVGELVAEAAKEGDDEFLVGERGAKVAQDVGLALDLNTVVDDVHVALAEGVELLAGLRCTLDHVVEELGGDGRPDGVGGVVGLDHGGEQVIGEGGVDPGNDTCVDLGPLRIEDLHLRVDGAIDMIQKTELLEGVGEERAPGAVVGSDEIKNDRNMGLDADELGGGGVDGDGAHGERVGGARGRRRARHRGGGCGSEELGTGVS